MHGTNSHCDCSAHPYLRSFIHTRPMLLHCCCPRGALLQASVFALALWRLLMASPLLPPYPAGPRYRGRHQPLGRYPPAAQVAPRSAQGCLHWRLAPGPRVLDRRPRWSEGFRPPHGDQQEGVQDRQEGRGVPPGLHRLRRDPQGHHAHGRLPPLRRGQRGLPHDQGRRAR